jgi:ribonuclease P protein component
VYRTENFVLYARPNNLGHARLGIVVAKRLAPRAVTRNLVKRLARDIFRKSGLVAADCIVRLNRPIAPKRQAPASSTALRRTLGAELTRLLLSQRATAV